MELSIGWFVGLLAVSVLAYHNCAQRHRVAVLAVSAYSFYALVAPAFLPLLVGTTVLTHVAGSRLAPGRGRAIFGGAVVVLLLALAWARSEYRGNPLVGPFVVVGASFYVLQAISYLADLYHGVRATRCSPAELTVYLAYFPKILAGPIERAAGFCAQLRAPRVVDDALIARAGSLVALGLVRKLIVADPLRSLLPPDAFARPEELGSPALAATLVLFAVTIYNDFAAYTDIARGVSLLFGIELTPNFARPMLATGVSDFWNRWHATLTHWLRDYVYLPTSRAILRRGPRLRNPVNLVVPPIATMLASAVWHGSGGAVVLWGLGQGALLASERAFLLRPGAGRPIALRSASVILLWTVGLGTLPLFFADWGTACSYWRGLSSLSGTVEPLGWSAFALVAASLMLDVAQQRWGELFFLGWPRVLRGFALAIAILVCFLFAHSYEVSPFVYQGF